jgi:hypothetical protein
MANKMKINRAPVLTLWAAVVAERMGYDHAEALTLAKAVAGLNAQSKGRRLGIYDAPQSAEGEDARGKAKGEDKTKARRPATQETVTLLGRQVPVKRTQAGIRATVKDDPIDPASVERYLRSKFGEQLPKVQDAMTALAKAYPPKQLAANGYELYESFRPSIPEGVKGWGAAGDLDLNKIKKLAASAESAA